MLDFKWVNILVFQYRKCSFIATLFAFFVSLALFQDLCCLGCFVFLISSVLNLVNPVLYKVVKYTVLSFVVPFWGLCFCFFVHK